MRFETAPLLWVVEDVYTPAECRSVIYEAPEPVRTLG